jgi:hypothetical protein
MARTLQGLPKPRSSYERWQDTIDKAITDPKWHEYDCDIQRIVATFNRHLQGDGYVPLDWRLIKAVIWTESGGPANHAWKTNPMQIGKAGDPGLSALLEGDEGGDLILPPSVLGSLTIASARSNPRANIAAGTGYLLMRHATYEIRSVKDQQDSGIYSVLVKPGDSLDKIAKNNQTTVQALRSANGPSFMLRPGQTLKYQKAKLSKAIVGWQRITPSSIARRYNVGDSAYSKKLSYCLEVMSSTKVGGEPCDA